MKIVSDTHDGKGLRAYGREIDRQRAETQLRNVGFTEFVFLRFTSGQHPEFGLYFTGYDKGIDEGEAEPDQRINLTE